MKFVKKSVTLKFEKTEISTKVCFCKSKNSYKTSRFVRIFAFLLRGYFDFLKDVSDACIIKNPTANVTKPSGIRRKFQSPIAVMIGRTHDFWHAFLTKI